MQPIWLIWAREMQAVAQTGLASTTDPFDRIRYEAIHALAARIVTEHSNADLNHIEGLFAQQTDHPTPKIEVRGAVFRDNAILMVREIADGGRWTLPGGWADVNLSPSENIIKEVREESGFEVSVRKLAAVYDRDRHGHKPPFLFHIYKLFFICEIVGGAATSSIETSEIAFFSRENLPRDLSSGRVLHHQLVRMFEHANAPELPTDFD